MKKLRNLGKLLSLIKMRMTQRSKSSNDAATFGVMPDYRFEGEGMRMDSISAGKTAEKHKFQAGDVVTKIDAHVVTDLISYMSVLSNYHVGDTAKVAFLREQMEMKMDVEFI